jgi:Zn-dependent M32 family carboxypeptidase
MNMTARSSLRHAATFSKRGSTVRADARKEVMELLTQVGTHKKARKFIEKYEKTGTMSKRDIKVLRELARKHAQIAA